MSDNASQEELRNEDARGAFRPFLDKDGETLMCPLVVLCVGSSEKQRKTGIVSFWFPPFEAEANTRERADIEKHLGRFARVALLIVFRLFEKGNREWLSKN